MTTGLIPILVACTINGPPLADTDTMVGVTLTMEAIGAADTTVADTTVAIIGVEVLITVIISTEDKTIPDQADQMLQDMVWVRPLRP